MAYGVGAMEQTGNRSASYNDFALVGILALMLYVLVFDGNLALFAVLFLLLALFYNPTKIQVGKRFSNDSDIIL